MEMENERGSEVVPMVRKSGAGSGPRTDPMAARSMQTLWGVVCCLSVVVVGLLWRTHTLEVALADQLRRPQPSAPSLAGPATTQSTVLETGTAALSKEGLRRMLVETYCHALNTNAVAKAKPATGAHTVELDARHYGTKKVHSIAVHRPTRFTIVTVCVDLPFCDVMEANFRQYATCHGYELVVHRKALGDPGRELQWSKVKAIQQAFGTDTDFVFWSDSDSLFMEQSIPLEAMVLDDKHSVFAESDLNTGHILFRNNEWSRAFVDKWYATYPSPAPWRDQSSFMWLAGGSDPDCRENLVAKGLTCYATVAPSMHAHIRRMDRRVMSSYSWEFQRGDFMIHFPGLEGSKLKMMQESAAQATLHGLSLHGLL